MSNQSVYCFRCGDPLTVLNGERYCVRGQMGLSKVMTELIEAAIATTPSGETVHAVEKSGFRCVRCRALMTPKDQRGLSFQCSACKLRYTKQMVFQMVELHPHAKC